MLITVFIVFRNNEFIGEVFSTERKAQQYINENRADGSKYHYKEVDLK